MRDLAASDLLLPLRFFGHQACDLKDIVNARDNYEQNNNEIGSRQKNGIARRCGK